MNEYDVIIRFEDKTFRTLMEGADLVDAIMKFFLTKGYSRLRRQYGEPISFKAWDAYEV